ncbi:hypothetical protein [Bacillus cihuensis]|uniref:hypothetical protein n=1 Tax=Bacillus cihuensis TaxID=1208599 RepID=UPI000686A528|nr:hypothetical protein [Bacillus cihuensis]
MSLNYFFEVKSNNNTTRIDVPEISHLDNFDESIKGANFVAHWVPDRFAGLVSSFYRESNTVEEFWKVIKRNKVVDYANGTRAFNKEQELTIAVKAFKEYVMKVKSGIQISNIFSYYNGIVNKLMDKLYFDVNFMNV